MKFLLLIAATLANPLSVVKPSANPSVNANLANPLNANLTITQVNVNVTDNRIPPIPTTPVPTSTFVPGVNAPAGLSREVVIGLSAAGGIIALALLGLILFKTCGMTNHLKNPPKPMQIPTYKKHVASKSSAAVVQVQGVPQGLPFAYQGQPQGLVFEDTLTVPPMPVKSTSLSSLSVDSISSPKGSRRSMIVKKAEVPPPPSAFTPPPSNPQQGQDAVDASFDYKTASPHSFRVQGMKKSASAKFVREPSSS